MIDLLALPQKTKVDKFVESVPRPASGVPINALPGWESIPLWKKLPMPKCPDNQIVFSRNKVGQKLWKSAEFVLYDPNCYAVQIDYDSLHDPHLRKFYSKEVNLNRLREIGKITIDNDVVCTLKDFNDYRRYLRFLHLDMVNKEQNERESKLKDEMMLHHAENIAEKEHLKFKQSSSAGLRNQIINQIKQKRENLKRLKFVEKLERVQQQIEKFDKIKETTRVVLREKSRLHNIAINQRKKHSAYLERTRVIAVKKRSTLRDIKLEQYKERFYEAKQREQREKAAKNWRKFLESQAKFHEREMEMRRKMELEKAKNIEERSKKMRKIWDRIQENIIKRTVQQTKSKHDDIPLSEKISQTLHQKISNGLADTKRKQGVSINAPQNAQQSRPSLEEVRNAIDTAFMLRNSSEQVDVTKIMESASHILKNIIPEVKRDLSQDEQAVKYLSKRVESLFDRIKTHVLKKAQHIIQNNGKLVTKASSMTSKKSIVSGSKASSKALSIMKTVSFGAANSIAQSGQAIDLNAELKSVQSRVPTPTTSMTSLMAVVKEHFKDDSSLGLSKSEPDGLPSDWTTAERVFVEHYYIKFKKALVIGVEQRVFSAIELYRNKFAVDTRRQILDLDRVYLVKIVVHSILTYHLNSYNFHGNLRLAISVLATDIIYHLQRTLMKLGEDAKLLAEIQSKCRCVRNQAGDCEILFLPKCRA